MHNLLSCFLYVLFNPNKKIRIFVSDHFSKPHVYPIVLSSNKGKNILFVVSSFKPSKTDISWLVENNVKYLNIFSYPKFVSVWNLQCLTPKRRLISTIKGVVLKLIFFRNNCNFLIVDGITPLTCGLTILDRWLKFIKVIYLPHGVHLPSMSFTHSKIFLFSKSIPSKYLHRKTKLHPLPKVYLNSPFILNSYRISEVIKLITQKKIVNNSRINVLFLGGFETTSDTSKDFTLNYLSDLCELKNLFKGNNESINFIYRPHPSDREIFINNFSDRINWIISNSSLEEDFYNATCVISFNSAGVLEALALGIPTGLYIPQNILTNRIEYDEKLIEELNYVDSIPLLFEFITSNINSFSYKTPSSLYEKMNKITQYYSSLIW